MKRNTLRALFIGLTVAFAALMVACDGDDEPDTPDSTPTAATSASPAASTTTASETPSPSATATQDAPTATPEPGDAEEPECPIEEVVCNIGDSVEAALADGNYGAIIDLMQARDETCPGGQPQGAGGPFPLCDGASQGEVRTGYQVARRYSEGGIVDSEGAITFLEGFVNAVTPQATDAHGDGQLRLQGVSCAQQSGERCQMATVFFTAILEQSRRELLIFWIPLPADPETPISSVWNGPIMADEEAVLFQTGGRVFDLGEVYLLEQ